MNAVIIGMHGRELFGCRKLYAFAYFYQRTRLTPFEAKTEFNSRNDDVHHAAIRYIYGNRAKARYFYRPLRVKYERWHVIKRHSFAFALATMCNDPHQACRRVNPNVSVLLLEAGGCDEVPSVTEPVRWVETLGASAIGSLWINPNQPLKGRSMPLSMGKVSAVDPASMDG